MCTVYEVPSLYVKSDCGMLFSGPGQQNHSHTAKTGNYFVMWLQKTDMEQNILPLIIEKDQYNPCLIHELFSSVMALSKWPQTVKAMHCFSNVTTLEKEIRTRQNEQADGHTSNVKRNLRGTQALLGIPPGIPLTRVWTQIVKSPGNISAASLSKADHQLPKSPAQPSPAPLNNWSETWTPFPSLTS